MKPVLDEKVIGRNRCWMKVSLDETVLDGSVVDETVFCFWMKVFLDESVFGRVFFAIWMKVYLTVFLICLCSVGNFNLFIM